MAATPRTEAADAASVGESYAFLSYSRRDGEFARLLHAALVERGKRVYADWQDIPDWSPDYEAELKQAILAADAFLFVLSPDAVVSPNCRFEVDVAVEEGKRIRPLLHRAVDGEAVPPALRKPQWIDFSTVDDFDGALAKLVAALEVEPEWVRTHTRLLVSAREWEARGRDPSLLLRGSELRESEDWLARQAGRQPAPTPLHADFVLASRRAASRRQRATLAFVTAGLAVAVALAIFALIQRNDAIERERLARSRELAALALSDSATDPRRSLQLAVEAVETSPTAEAVDALRRTIGAPREVAATRGSGITAAFTGPESVHVVCEDGSLRALSAATRGVVCPDANGSRRLAGATFSPDGTRAFLVPLRGPARVVNGESGSVLITLPAPAGDRTLAQASFDRDASHLVVVSDDGSAGLWNLATPGRPLWRGADVAAAAFSPDGRRFATGHRRGGGLRVWATATGRQVTSLSGLRGPVYHLALGRRGVVVAGDDAEARLWNLSRRNQSTLLPGDGSSPTEVAVSDDGTRSAIGVASGAVDVFDTADAEQALLSFRGHGGTVSEDTLIIDVEFSADSALVASASADGTARVWDAVSGDQIAVLGRGSVAVIETGFGAGGRMVLAHGEDGSARLWRLAATQTRVVPTPEVATDAAGNVESIAVRPGGGIVAGIDDGSALLWNPSGRTKTLSAIGTLTGHTPDGRLLVSIDEGEVRVWEAATGAIRRAIRHPDALAAALSPDGDRIATVDADMAVRIWSVDSGTVLARFDWPIPVEPEAAAAVFSPAGDRVAVVVGYTPSLYDLERGRALELEGHVDRVGTVAFSSDGRSIVTSSADGTARVYRSDGTPRKTLAGHEMSAGEDQGVTSAVFHPDGSLVLTTGADGTARVWDATTGVERNVLEAVGTLDAATFSPDGDLAAATDGSRVYVWSVASGEPIAVVRGGSEVRALRFTPDGASLVAGERRRVRVTACDGCGAVERLLALAHRRLDPDRDGTAP